MSTLENPKFFKEFKGMNLVRTITRHTEQILKSQIMNIEEQLTN